MRSKRDDLSREIPELDGGEEACEPLVSAGMPIEIDGNSLADGDWAQLNESASEPFCDVDQESLPPERVRFTAPAGIWLEREDERRDAAVLNLSDQGVAIMTPIRLCAGERLTIEFALALGQESQRFACSVVWCDARERGSFVSGLRFTSLSAEAQESIQATVDERSEGRAADWPLPILPEAQAPARATSPWLSAAAGMAAGIGLALGLSVIPNAGVSRPPPPPQGVVIIPAAAALSDRAPPVPATAPAPAPEPPALPEPLPPAVPATAVVAPAAAPVAASAPASSEQVEAQKPKPATSGLLPRVAAPAEGTSEPTLRPVGSAETMQLALLTDGVPRDHTSFWMENPRRLVVDVYGRKSGFERQSYTISHPLAKQLRVGQHNGKVRFVLELSDKAGSKVQTRASGNAVLVEVRRR